MFAGFAPRIRRIVLLASVVLLIGACGGIFPGSIFHADGKLSTDELNYFLSEMRETTGIGARLDRCIKTEAARRAEIAGDPQAIDPKSLNIPKDNWLLLDKSNKRLILAQLIVTQSSVFCTMGREM
ncbi:hypothetical protein KR52_03280 [Synechococcus sp. KORDI-52]|nr:hypothetical protein KR52_03280 [Synechococcus sp. KORDI-52]